MNTHPGFHDAIVPPTRHTAPPEPAIMAADRAPAVPARPTVTEAARPCRPSPSSPASSPCTSPASRSRACSRPASCSRSRRPRPGASTSRTTSRPRPTTSPPGATRRSCSTSRGSGPTEHQLFIQAGIEGLRDLLAIDLDDVPDAPRARRDGAQLGAAGGPDGRDLVGAGPDARGRVAAGADRPVPATIGADGHPSAAPSPPLVTGVAAALVIVADRDPAVPQPGLGRVRAGPRPGRRRGPGSRPPSCGP